MGEFFFCVDYIGFVIVIDVGWGCGWGFILMKDVEVGELLFVFNFMVFLLLLEDE